MHTFLKGEFKKIREDKRRFVLHEEEAQQGVQLRSAWWADSAGVHRRLAGNRTSIYSSLASAPGQFEN